jgi:hypothetical protein
MDCALSGNEITHGETVDFNERPSEYCREIEAYLCRKNDGHLIRVVGPSFDLVSGWAAQGIPLKIAFSGIDRYFERYYRKGPRRRPVKIDFCEADVLDVFDEWRRALGIAAATGEIVGEDGGGEGRTKSSLPAHLERVVDRLTNARATGRLDDTFEPLIDAAARELDVARGSARGVRGGAREALLERLTDLDSELLRHARAVLDDASLAALEREAEADVIAYRDRMAPEIFSRTRDAAFDRLLRERFGLPVVAFR